MKITYNILQTDLTICFVIVLLFFSFSQFENESEYCKITIVKLGLRNY